MKPPLREAIGCLSLLVACTLLSLAPVAQAVRAQAPSVMEQIRKAWKFRQDKAPSFRLAWTQRETLIKGRAAVISKGLGRDEVPESRAEPADRVFVNPCELWVDGDKVRWQYEKDTWDPGPCQYEHYKEVTTWNGWSSKLLSEGAPDWPLQGVDYGQQGSDAVGRPDLHPIWMTLRGLTDGKRSWILERMQLLGKTAVQDNQRRLVLSEKGTYLLCRKAVDSHYSSIRLCVSANNSRSRH